jgi:hypothetical protein
MIKKDECADPNNIHYYFNDHRRVLFNEKSGWICKSCGIEDMNDSSIVEKLIQSPKLKKFKGIVINNKLNIGYC